MYKAIIFDFFDVIRTDAYKSWLHLHGYTLEGKFLEVVQKMDRGEIVVDEFLAALGEITGQSSAEIFAGMETSAKVDHEVLELAERLRREHKIGLLSNAPSAFLRNLLQAHDLEKYFDEIVISSEVGLIKPQAEIFHHILEKMHVTPAEAIFIDDSQRNIDGAQTVGIQGILYTDPQTLQRSLQNLGITLR